MTRDKQNCVWAVHPSEEVGIAAGGELLLQARL